jgi:uncharacterized repeat protein (TIGR01451 family)
MPQLNSRIMKLRSILGIVACLFTATTLPAQIITNVVPPLGGHGDFVQIFGNGFAPGNKRPNTLTIKFNGTTSTTSTNAVVSDSEIDVTNVPTAATSGTIQVIINGTTVTSPQSFLIVPTNMPYATNFTPAYGASGTPVTITGVHFQSAGVNGVTFNGVSGGSFFLNSDHQISVNAPGGVTTGPLVIQSSLGASHNFSTISNIFSTATNFFVQASITSFSPPSGRTGTNVILTGANFSGISGITFSGVTASDFTISNNTTIRVTVPAGTSTGRIVVSPPSGTALSAAQSATDFKILPSIGSFSPGSGPTNTVVTVLGSGLNEKSPHPDVTVGGAAVVTFGTVSPGTLSFNVPANAASGPITITTTNGSVVSSQTFFLPAAVTNIGPTAGAVGTLVHLSGNNFTNASAVAFNGVTASFVVTNNNNIGVIAPVGVSSGVISVTTPFGATNSAQLFYVAPVISDFTPTHGVTGTRVTINGNSFTNASAVAFNGVPATSFVVTNNSTLSAVVPTNASAGKITVTAPGGIGQSATDFSIDIADLGITASDSPDPVFVGSNLVYTIVITNAGPVTALNVRLTNTLPASVTLKSASTTVGTLATNSNPITGAFGDIPNTGSAKIILTVVPTVNGTITNVASVSSESFDANPGNNSVAITTTVWPLPYLSIANLMSNGLVKITWPAPLSGFTLLSSTNFPAEWTIDATPRSVTGTNISVIETNVESAKFYRLTN